MPKISVIVPVYKVEPYLHRCVDSILTQTFPDFELILVDDGSPDTCGKICDEYAAKDRRVHVIHQQNGGLSAARNAGLDWTFTSSDSEWVNFIDSDDWVHPQYLEALYRAAMENEVGISVCGFARTEGEDPTVDAAKLDAAMWRTEDFFVENNVNAIIAWGKLYRKADFAEIRYPVGKIHEDEFTTYKILFRYGQVAVIGQPLYAYYQNPNGIMQAEWTPRRLVITDALAERILFFEQRELERMRRDSIKILLWYTSGNIATMRTFGKQYETEYRDYLKRYKDYMNKYRKELPRNDWEDIYGSLHPKQYCIILFFRYAREKGVSFAIRKVVGYLYKKEK